jgi:trehalose/maltose hydrolase-like predicted phosphorylase
MLFYLFSSEELRDLFTHLGYPFESESIPPTINYYLQRTSDGSTLSRVVHSWVLARTDRAKAWALLKRALESDIADIQGGTTQEGIHLGAMAGTVDIVQRGQIGLEIRGDLFRVNPCLAEDLKGLRLRLRYRGEWLDMEIQEGRMTLTIPERWSGADHIVVRNERFPVKPGTRLELRCSRESGGLRPISGQGEPGSTPS